MLSIEQTEGLRVIIQKIDDERDGMGRDRDTPTPPDWSKWLYLLSPHTPAHHFLKNTLKAISSAHHF